MMQPDFRFVLIEPITSPALIAETGRLPGKLSASVSQRLRDDNAGTIRAALACTTD